MPLRDLLKKKEKVENTPSLVAQSYEPPPPAAPEFRFVRTDTYTQETISPPTFEGDPVPQPQFSERKPSRSPNRHSLGLSRKDSAGSASDRSGSKEHRRLSDRLHLRNKSRSSSAHSSNLPPDLPEIQDAYNDNIDQQDKEAQWEKRATMLAGRSPGSSASAGPPTNDMAQLNLNEKKGRPRSISDAQSDVNIQEAIRLHEAGQLEQATTMFHQLAERGNVLSQVLFGLSLRHGWGCEKDEKRAFTYLSAAASNSAELESQALQAGMKKGGAAKGELVLAIFELANCFRYGWGVSIDKAAARQYYETAANLGDTDAMNEAAWCYLEGFGGKKDKVSYKDYIFIHYIQPCIQLHEYASTYRINQP